MIRDGHDVTPRGRRARDVLAVLLLRRGQAVDPLVLLDQVWEAEAASLDATVVHTVVARLRRTLGAETIQTAAGGYRLSPAATFDDHEFTALVTSAREAARTDHTSPARLLREALGLWRALPAYADVNEALVATERPRLHEQRYGAQEALATALLASPGPDAATEALALAEELVTREPLRERAHELVMLAAYRCGRQADALAAHDRLRRLLRDELGVDPGQEATRLHARILAQDPTLLAESGTGSLAEVPPPAPPAPTTALIGREAELASATHALETRRLLTLVGPGGVGKSRLLAELHTRVRETGAVGYLDLSSLGEAEVDEVVEALSRALAIALPPSDPTGSLVAALVGRDLTLFLDEAEWAAAAVADVVSRLVLACPRLTVVAASRRALGVVGERQLSVEPLACPAPGAAPAAVLASPAVRLLTERLADQTPHDSREHDPAALAEVVRRVDGLPLAIELVAGYAGGRGVSDLVDLLDAPLDLVANETGRPRRHRSLRDTILWSTDRLSEPQREVLRRLGVFVGSFDLTAAEAVVGPGHGDVAATCRSLAREALLQVRRRSDGALSWRMLRAVRELAVEGLAELDDGAELAAAHARHREWHAARWRGALRSDRLIADVRHHHDDYLEALRGALLTRETSTLGDLTLTLGRWWIFTDAIGPGLRWNGRALASGVLDETYRARVLVQRASMLVHQFPEESTAAAAEAVVVLEEVNDHAWLVGAHLTQALERLSSGDQPAALAQARRSVHFARLSTGERLADALGVLAIIEAGTGDEASTLQTVDEAWALAHGSGSAAAMASVANNLCLALLEFGHTEAAQRMLDTVLASLGELEMPLFLTHTSGWILLAAGDPAGAIGRFATVVRATPEAVADRRAAESYAGVACALSALGSPEPAAELVVGAEELFVRLGMTLPEWILELIAAVPHHSIGLEPATSQELGSRLAALVLASEPPPDQWGA